MSMADGGFLAPFDLDTSAGLCSDAWGDGIGEYDLSEKLVVEEAGDIAPPHPKNDPSLEAPGDLGNFCMVALESFDS